MGRSDSRSRSRGAGRGGPAAGGGQTKGYVVNWNEEKGFGFIKPDHGGDDVFAHVSGLKDGDALKEGSEVTYEEIYDDRKGKYRAEGVTGCCDRRDVKGRGGGGGWGKGGGGGRGRDDSRDRGRGGARGGGYGGGGGGGYGGGRDRSRGRGYDSRPRGKGRY